jgi:thiamine-monophosphate kinase
MNLSEIGELPLLDIVKKKFSRKVPGLVVGIGDDAAVIRTGKTHTLLTTDMMVEGVHFDLRWTTPFQLGFKLVSANVSDIYAMGGRPRFLLLNFAAPGHSDVALFHNFFEGIGKAVERYDLSLVGGDISASEKVVLSATVTGDARKIVTRSGARVGDLIYVSGFLGDSACGLRLMKRIKKPVRIEKNETVEAGPGWEVISPLLRRHLMPEAVKPAKYVRQATSMIDISDGLLIDLSRLCRESKIGVKIFEERIPISYELREAAKFLKMDPLELAFGGGEDYELLFTAPENKKVKAFCIGVVTRSGMKVVNEKGNTGSIAIRGYQHFAD